MYFNHLVVTKYSIKNITLQVNNCKRDIIKVKYLT